MHARVAANPIPYWAFGTESRKTRENFDAAFNDLSAIGFKAVKADVPAGMTAAEYLKWIRGYGLEPALGLYESTFDRQIPIDQDIEAAKRFAAQQIELGLDRTMLCTIFVDVRVKTPAVGAGFDAGRLENVIADIAVIAEAIRNEGVFPLLHSHVGGWVETEHEVTRVLDTIPSDQLGFGPDTGHLIWGGSDPAEIIRRYSSRVGGIHLKDMFPDFLDESKSAGRTYEDVSASGRLWAEPGRGVVDFDAVISALPDDFDGDFMIEVDEPSVGSKYESLRECFDWAQRALGFAKL